MSGDDFLDDFKRRLDEQYQRSVDHEFEKITTGVRTVATDQPCPMPLEWHPFYAGKTWLVDWLNDTGRFGDRHIIQLPVLHRASFLATETGPSAAEVPMDRITLTKRKCWGPAPYVGRPFAYVWPVAIDDYGRAVAGESRIEYTMSETEWDYLNDPGPW